MITPEAREHMNKFWADWSARLIAHPPEWLKRLEADFDKCFEPKPTEKK
jgi:hypothetical protein